MRIKLADLLFQYYMETEDKPGQAMDPNAVLQSYKNCPLFYVVREHSR